MTYYVIFCGSMANKWCGFDARAGRSGWMGVAGATWVRDRYNLKFKTYVNINDFFDMLVLI